MNRLVILIAISLCIQYLKAQIPVTQWQYFYGGSADDEAYSVARSKDNGCVFVARSSSNDGDVTGNHGGTDIWITKLDSLGIIVWQKCLGSSGGEQPFSIDATADSGYIVAGIADSGNICNYGSSDFWIIKLDMSGNVQWQNCFGGSGNDVSQSIIQTNDTGFIVAGYTSSHDGDVTGLHGASDFWVVKISSTGNLQWQKSYGGTNGDFGRSICSTTDGGFLIAGQTNSNDGDVTGNHGGVDYWLVKIDYAGNLQWQKCYGGSLGDQATSAISTDDGGYIISGYSSSHDGDITSYHGQADYWIVKTDSAGSIVWQKCFGGFSTDWANDIIETGSNGYIIAGQTMSNSADVSGNHGLVDGWVIKINSAGTLEWQECLGTTASEWFRSLILSTDSGIILTGQSDYDTTGGTSDIFILKQKLLGLTESQELSSTDIEIYPNPAKDKLEIKSSGLKFEKVEVVNLVGERVFIDNCKANLLSINISVFPAGVYFIEIKTGIGSIVRKFIRE